MAILQDRRGELWVGTDGGGLNRFPAGGGRTTVYRHDPRDPTTIGSDAVLTLLEEPGGDIWLGGWVVLDDQSGRASAPRRRGRPSPPRAPIN